LIGFFQHFRPCGEGVEDVFEDVVLGDEISARIKTIYEATAEGYDPRDMYFEVKSPPAMAETEIKALVGSHVRNLLAIAKIEHNETVSSALDPLPKIELFNMDEVAEEGDCESVESVIAEMCGDYLLGLSSVDSQALLLEEAFYSVASNYNLVCYLLWPLYRHAASINEPFEPIFELWRHGIRLQVLNDLSMIRVLVPSSPTFITVDLAQSAVSEIAVSAWSWQKTFGDIEEDLRNAYEEEAVEKEEVLEFTTQSDNAFSICRALDSFGRSIAMRGTVSVLSGETKGWRKLHLGCERCIHGVFCWLIGWSVCHFTTGVRDGQKEHRGSGVALAGDPETPCGWRPFGPRVLCFRGSFATFVLRLAEEVSGAEARRLATAECETFQGRARQGAIVRSLDIARRHSDAGDHSSAWLPGSSHRRGESRCAAAGDPGT